MKLLVTGGLGFIGSNLIRLLRQERPSWSIVNLDLVTYAANPANLEGVVDQPMGEGEVDGYRFVRGDVADRELVADLYAREQFDVAVHCAAETHVDRSIHDVGHFLRTNVDGTLVLLEAGLEHGVRHVQMSTDEVYGSLGRTDAPFTEATPLGPRSPYSASKAAADQLAVAFYHTYGLDVLVTRCSNNYGPFQHPEKLIPLMITSALLERPLPVYGDGQQRRDWIHVEDHCRGVLHAVEAGRAGEVYNFGGSAERANLDVVRAVVDRLGVDPALVTFVADRPGHDRRYAMSWTKAEAELGWAPMRTFEDGLAETVDWYRRNTGWWEEAAAAAYEASRARITAWSAAAPGDEA